MSKLQEKMSEKMFTLFSQVVKSLGDMEYAIQKDAEYFKNGNPNNQAKNEMSKERPADLDYGDVNKDRLEEYFIYDENRHPLSVTSVIKIEYEYVGGYCG